MKNVIRKNRLESRLEKKILAYKKTTENMLKTCNCDAPYDPKELDARLESLTLQTPSFKEYLTNEGFYKISTGGSDASPEKYYQDLMDVRYKTLNDEIIVAVLYSRQYHGTVRDSADGIFSGDENVLAYYIDVLRIKKKGHASQGDMQPIKNTIEGDWVSGNYYTQGRHEGRWSHIYAQYASKAIAYRQLSEIRKKSVRSFEFDWMDKDGNCATIRIQLDKKYRGERAIPLEYAVDTHGANLFRLSTVHTTAEPFNHPKPTGYSDSEIAMIERAMDRGTYLL